MLQLRVRERNRLQTESFKLDLAVILWLSSPIKEAAVTAKENSFYRNYIGNLYGVWVDKYVNRRCLIGNIKINDGKGLSIS